MKRILNLSCLSLVIVMLFASCKSNKSLTQRHYNNRYYIGMSQRERTPDETVNQQTEKQEEVLIASENRYDYEADEYVIQDFNSTDSVTENQTDFIKNEERSSNNIEPLNLRTTEKRTIGNYPSALLKKTSELKEKAAPSSSSDDALSLLWIIIVIILILWLFGLAFGGFGIGGAIHLLALIALILLILWLLRVI